MSQYVTKIRTSAGDLPVDYNSLANLPTPDATLSVSGSAADAKAVGDRFNTMATTEYVDTSISIFSNPNLLINGDFQVWQRGDSFSNISNTYTADRWMIKNAKGNTSAVVKSTDVPSDEPMQQSIHITETLEENSYLRYNFESALKGVFTLSFWYKTTAAFNSYVYDNGALIHLGNLDTLNEWAKATFTFTVTSMTFINIIHAMSIGDTYITGVKLEYGNMATQFVPKLRADEIMACYRYFYAQDSRLLMNQYSSEFADGNIYYPTRMRNVPSVTLLEGTYYCSAKSAFLTPASIQVNASHFSACNCTIKLERNSEDTFTAGMSINANVKICLDAEIY